MNCRLSFLLAFSLLTAVGHPAFALDGSDTGVLIGAGAGGLIGSQFGSGRGNTAATVGGVVAGGVVGGTIGASYDHVSYRSSPEDSFGASDYDSQGLSGQANVPFQPTYYGVQNVDPYVSQEDIAFDQTLPVPSRFCRKYAQATKTDSGALIVHHGITCRMADGAWQPVD